MKTLRVSLLLLLLGAAARGQDPSPPQPAGGPGTAAAPSATATPRRSAEELEQLLSPIALYPDALIALILPATTVPTDVVLAARHVRENPGDRAQIEHRSWDDSVKSLTSYPDVLKWMDENLHWTQQVGEAFVQQPAEVMEAIQRLRAKARAAGTLVDTPQQQIIAESQVIRIVPAQPDVIYVPYYEPEVVFVDRPVYYSRPFLTFGVGVAVGSWLAYDCDWRHRTIWVGNRHRRWTGHDWRHPVVPIAPPRVHPRTPEVRQWCPPPQPRTTFAYSSHYRAGIVRPTPFGSQGSQVSRSHPNSYTDRSYTDRSYADRSYADRSQAERSPVDRSYSSRSGHVSGRRPDAPQPGSAPAVSSLPSTFGRGTRQPAADASPAQAVPPPSTIVNLTPAAPTPNLQPLPNERRGGRERDGARDPQPSPGRHYRGNSQPGAVSTAPTPPASVPAPGYQSAPPSHSRSFSRANVSPTPAMPMASRAAPVSQAAVAAPPPAVIQPAAPPAQAAQPAAAPAAPARQRGGENRGEQGNENNRARELRGIMR